MNVRSRSRYGAARGTLVLGSLLVMGTPIGATPSQATVKLVPLRGSAARGTAVLTQQSGKLTVLIKMDQTMSGQKMPEGAHIHRGSCPNPDPKPLYPLEPVVKGTSTTTLESVDLATLTSGQYTVSVHKTTTGKTDPIACGDIKLANPSGTSG
ncbi:MAG: hypothetical protein JO060_06640 [Candidatus Eremiobacteraeota bacterium]|nr:hypothetical protein [Candidatus Eremiobacteraeota bacterium]MBV9645946.1 hypothetical protein [Candidatus Eremiobacteraeota bacterium]